MANATEAVLERVARGELTEAEGRELIARLDAMRPPTPKMAPRSTAGFVLCLIVAMFAAFYFFTSLGLINVAGWSLTIISVIVGLLAIFGMVHCAKSVPAKR